MWAIVLLIFSLMGFAETNHKFKVIAKDGQRFEVNAFYYNNSNGGKEIRLESAALPRINKKVNSIFGYGRDLDDDNLIDTWFLFSQQVGLFQVMAPCKDSLCQTTIENKVFANYERSDRMLLYSAYASLVGYFFMSLDNRYEKSMDYYREQVNLEEFRIRLDRELDAKVPSLSREQLGLSIRALAYGIQENHEMYERANGRDAYGLLVADSVLHVAGGAILKFAGKFISTTGFAQGFAEYLKNFLSARSKTLSAYALKLEKFKVGASIVGTAAVQRMNRVLYKQTVTHGITTMKTRSSLYKNLHLLQAKTGRALKAGFGQWRYLALNAGIQVSSEIYANYDDVYNENPEIMAKNVLNNKHIQQNVSYMASETLLMTMAVRTFKTVKTRYAMCAFIAVANSTFTNLVMRDEVNPERVMMDTTWEMIVGSSQVQFDQWMLDKFEKIGKETGNTKLKLLGYVAVVVEQGLGYVVYSKSAEFVDEREKKKVQKEEDPIIMMQPVFARVP